MEKEGYKLFNELTANALRSAMKENRHVKEMGPITDPLSSASRLRYEMLQTIEKMDEVLCRFEKNFLQQNNHVIWSADYEDVIESLQDIIHQHHIQSYTALDSIDSCLMKELGVGFTFQKHKLNPSSNGDLLLIEVDRMVAETGSLLLLNKDANYMQKLNSKSINVCFVSIDRLLNGLKGVALMVDTLRDISPTPSQSMAHRYMLFGGSPNCETYLFIVDNERSALLKNKQLRAIFACLDCDRCQQACPIDQLIGSEPYDNVFTGPRARVMLPHLELMHGYNHIPYVCTMCGACEEACPMQLPLRQMMIATKRDLAAQKKVDAPIADALGRYRKYVMDRSKMNRPTWLRQQLINHMVSPQLKENRLLPSLAPDTFNSLMKKK